MLLIGLLIVVAAAAFAGAVVSENWGGNTYTVHGFGHVLGHLTLAEIFLSAVILTTIFFLGLWVASVSSRIRRRTSSRRRAEARATREERDALLAERDRLARELDTERAANPDLVHDGAGQIGQSAAVSEQSPASTSIMG
jgi:uncharacterized membrane protein